MADNQITNPKLNDETDPKQAGTQPPRNDVTEQRGGLQADQLSGETEKGAQNQAKKNRNPQGNDPDQNQSARQKGNTF
jgi:hypothetical protein